MKRRRFISGATVAAGGLLVPAGLQAHEPGANTDAAAFAQPPFLKAGDTIAITCPAGFITMEEVQPAIRTMESWGFTVRLGNTVGRRYFSFGGTDEERAHDLQILLDDSSVKAIMCARGGYGVTRILDRLSLTRLKERPKWIIGFSDITALHVHLARVAPMASIHSKMCNSFPADRDAAEPVVQDSILSIRQTLTGTKMRYSCTPDELNRTGVGQGILVGGNLSMLNHLMGTPSEINTYGRILFLEETGEYPYSIDRMFVNLRRAGKLSNLAGLIIGGFKMKPDDPGEEFGRTLYDIVREKTAPYKYPVCFNFPAGHQKHNVALKCGARHVLTVRKDAVELAEV
jgi:muramoyltetrapeptide carboxypeptidase